MRINTVFAKPFANLIRVAKMSEGMGICGIGVNSINMVDKLNTHSHLLLAHLIAVELTKVPDNLAMHTVQLNKGPVTMDMIFKCLNGVTYKSSALTAKNMYVASGIVTFEIITGQSGISNPLSKDAVELFAKDMLPTNQKLIGVPLPFMSKIAPIYTIEDLYDGYSEVTFKDLNDDEIARVFKEISK